MCVGDRLEESDTVSKVRQLNNETHVKAKRFLRILTGQRRELKSRSPYDLCDVHLNTVILIDSTALRFFKTNIKC